MTDIHIRRAGRAGRITLNRPKALNALTWEMCLEIEAALDSWRDDPAIALIVIDAAGDRAFCAGGDIAVMYETARAGDYDYGRRFWRDEYRMNAKLAEYPKPIVSFLQGFTMGGGVGVGCHAAHRVVGDTSRIAMPECGIGLVPDVGGSWLLARAPGHTGEYLGVTGARMGPGDAIFAGFADHYLPEAAWPARIAALEESGLAAAVTDHALPAPGAPLAAMQDDIDRAFAAATLGDLARWLVREEGDVADSLRAALARNAPLSMACALELIRRQRAAPDIRAALGNEFRFTYRAAEKAGFIEGIRAAIIDKDRSPRWQHAGPEAVTVAEVAAMLMPLGDAALTWEERT
jgi:enoyl-CoA hydratase